MSICDDVIIGAGAVVLSNITEKGTYVGIPAKRIK
jgi:serine acetyltransferase